MSIYIIRICIVCDHWSMKRLERSASLTECQWSRFQCVEMLLKIKRIARSHRRTHRRILIRRPCSSFAQMQLFTIIEFIDQRDGKLDADSPYVHRNDRYRFDGTRGWESTIVCYDFRRSLRVMLKD